MSLFQEFLPRLGGRAVLLSIKPKYAELILAGSKRVEFRRSWATQEVSVVVLYSSSPVQKIVGVVEVNQILVDSPTSLWKICVEKGGGLTREEFRLYFSGKSKGIAVLLGDVYRPEKQVTPSDVIPDFVAPQSFRYLDVNEFIKIEKRLAIKKGEK